MVSARGLDTTAFTEVDGVLCASRADELARAQGPMLAPSWLASDAVSLHAACRAAAASDPVGPLFRERVLEGVFALAHYPEHASLPDVAAPLLGNPASLARLAAWLDRHPLPDGGVAALEVGCGPGRFLCELAPRCRSGAIGLDLRVGMARLARRILATGQASLPWRTGGRAFEPLTLQCRLAAGHPVRLMQGNLHGAPLVPGAHPLVAALSFLDVLADPLAGLDALHALVAPGGMLLLATPYQWDPEVTPPSRWWVSPEAVLRDALDARGYDLLEEEDAVPWAIPSHQRLVHHYTLHAILARKRRRLVTPSSCRARD